MLFSKAYPDYNSVIYHVHVPKSGGSSVRENLSIYFKDYQVLRILEPSINHYYGNQINSFTDYKEENKIKKWLNKCLVVSISSPLIK
jgi:hypothetical protein